MGDSSQNITKEVQGINIIRNAQGGLNALQPAKRALSKVDLDPEAKPEVRATEKVAVNVNQERFPVNIVVRSDGLTTLSATSEELITPSFEAGWFYIIKNISAYQDTAGTPQMKLNIKQRYSDEVLRITAMTPGFAEDTLDWQGELYIDDSNRIAALFESASTTAANRLNLVVHGYRVKK